MRKKMIMDESRWLLEAITEEYETICTHAEKIPKIEIDILMENVRKFYENLRILQRLEDPHLTEEHMTKPVAAKPTPVSSVTPHVAPHVTPPVAPTVAPVIEKPPTPAVTIKYADPAKVIAKPVELVLPRPESPPPVKRVPKMPEIDLFGQEDQSHSMKLQDARERAFSPKIPGNRIENLKMAIPINEKFMFINDLFDGNLREYNETIETLNGFKTFDQAAEYLDLMKRKNFWNVGSTAFQKLKELVERRF